MLLTNQQIEKIIEIIDYYTNFFIGKHVGADFLTSKDKSILKKYGIDVKIFSKEMSTIETAFKFGMIASALSKKSTKAMTFDQLKKFLKSGKFLPLSPAEKYALDYVKSQSYNDIKGLGNRMSKDTLQVFIEASKSRRLQYEKKIKTQASLAIKNRSTVVELSSNLGHKTKDWSRDFDRIADYILHDAYQQGIATQLLKDYGDEAEVYYSVYDGACKHCKRIYLMDENTGEPRVFKLKDVIANGSNIGRKVEDWVASVSPIHPWSLTDGKTKVLTEKGYVFIQDIEIGDYVLTHKGRFRKVLSTIKHFPVPENYPIKKQFTFKFKIDSSHDPEKLKSITVTAEHKILTQRGWIRAMNIKEEDKFIKLLKPCGNKKCKNYVDFSVDNRTYCSKQCLNEERRNRINKQWESDFMTNDMKLRISEKVKQNWENGIHKTTLLHLQSEENKLYHKKRLETNDTAVKMLMKAANTLTTKPQLKLYNLVKSIFPDAELEYVKFNKSLDIAIPNLKIDIEYDGKYFHKGERLTSDEKRDKLLRKNGWHVLRYSKIPTLKQIKSDIETCVNNSTGKYKFEEISIESITISSINEDTKLYDIEVEEDESFVAKGIVIHNCRCTIHNKPKDSVWNNEKKTFVLTINDHEVNRKSKIKITIS